MDLESKLRNDKHLTQTEQLIAEYVLAHPVEASRISARELGRRALTSGSAVLRFCHKLGFENYNDFKVNLVSDLKRMSPANTMIASGERAITAMAKMETLERQVIAETKEKLDPEVVERIAQEIHDHPCVDFFAFDTNATLASYAAHNLMLTGHLANVYQDLDRTEYFSLYASTEHLAFLISRSGTDRALVAASREMARRGLVTVAVTAKPESALARQSTYVLRGFYHNEFDKFGDVVFDASLKYLFDILFVMTFSKDSDYVYQINQHYYDLYYRELDRSSSGEDANRG
ncbi:MAG: MurR/RpiR family transcriptional regulator [Parafannyhessea sp.]|uniref:MurR/RpiR family transcriptional regulator n=1 Tax=Parafannyhessea sp. TaxID=2847324 RepID=UPI003EFE1990